MAYKVIKASGSISGLTKREFIVDTAAEITDVNNVTLISCASGCSILQKLLNTPKLFSSLSP